MRIATDLLDPIHEEFHVWGATFAGDHAVRVGMSYTRVSELSLIFLLAGYWGELLLYGGLSLLIARKRFWPAGIFAGIYFAVLSAALGSKDFVMIERWIGGDGNLIAWLLVGFAGCCIIIYTLFRRWEKDNVLRETKGAGTGQVRKSDDKRAEKQRFSA